MDDTISIISDLLEALRKGGLVERVRDVGQTPGYQLPGRSPPEVRQEREADFRTGKLPVLYCSATMELGVDIARLNVLNLRNVPPTPANCAQRSGRAGRSDQPGLVFSSCPTFRSHDQYFFCRPLAMVSGSVTPPRIELGNEDLVRSHVHAMWLAATQFRFDEPQHPPGLHGRPARGFSPWGYPQGELEA